MNIARQTVTRYLDDGTTPLYTDIPVALEQPSGAFVTLRKNGELCGCVGHMLGSQELCHAVQHAAVSAATQDSCFPPVIQDELQEITIEISVLSPMRWVHKMHGIKVGRDWLYILWGPYSGVLLPQVAVEQGWDRDEFLTQVCMKDGLPADAWQQGASLYRFTAQVFAESD